MPAQGSRHERGYDREHVKVREAMRPSVEAGEAWCWRCGLHIDPEDEWDAGHDDRYPGKRVYRGPEHASCSRKAGNRKRWGKREPEMHPNRRVRH